MYSFVGRRVSIREKDSKWEMHWGKYFLTQPILYYYNLLQKHAERYDTLYSNSISIIFVFQYHETLQIFYGISSYLELSLSGQGVNPVINITPNEGPIDWDHILMEDTVTKNVTIENPSEFPVRFFIRLENHMSETKGKKNYILGGKL